MPPNTRDQVTSAFVDVVDRANKLSAVQISDAAETENEQGDYGYGVFWRRWIRLSGKLLYLEKLCCL